ncbi:MAG: acetyl-CoA carboxylase biotin carboxyl carrier protein subunit [Marinilabiliales bacterium]|nr:MAG: acetyl-CoA carboxylase biotin carboxyl carrier protein subunit [Marinilabiliales bacterium]
MKKYKFKISGNEYNVYIQKVEKNMAKIEVNGTPTSKTPTLVRPKVPSAKPKEQQLTANASLSQIKAPLPGIILELKVAVGDTVDKGETLLIMEAMKMENNVMADKAGNVTAIKTKIGDNVLQGDVLIEIQ